MNEFKEGDVVHLYNHPDTPMKVEAVCGNYACWCVWYDQDGQHRRCCWNTDLRRTDADSLRSESPLCSETETKG